MIARLQVALTARGPMVRATVGGRLLGYYATPEEALADVSCEVELVEGVADLRHVVPPALRQSHTYDEIAGRPRL